jgi:hypothetical protein
MRLTFGASVPPGAYRARFLGCSPSKPHAEYGPGIAFEFAIVGGQFDGEKVGRVTGLRPTPKNACGKLVRGLLGRAPSPGESVDLDGPVGKSFHVTVEETDTGSTRVSGVFPDNGAAT